MSDQRPQPPPNPDCRTVVNLGDIPPLKHGDSITVSPSGFTVPPKEQEFSRSTAWIRLSKRHDDHWEVWAKGRYDMMILLAYNLSHDNAQKLQQELITVLKKYDSIPFNSSYNVERKQVETNVPAQVQGEGSLGQS